MKVWRKLPSFVRWSLVTMLILIMVGGGVWAYKALTAEVETTVDECLSFVGENFFEVSLYPGESDTVEITIANASSVSIDVSLISTITPTGKGFSVSIPNKITAPALGQVSFDVGVSASKSVEPGIYYLTIDFDR